MKRFRSIGTALFLSALLISLLCYPSDAIAAARNAVSLCVDTVIPSLFPFFVCSRLCIDLGIAHFLSRLLSTLLRPLFGIPGSGAIAVILGILSGYPIGASCVVNLYQAGECTKQEAEHLLRFCNNAGPMFVLGVLGCRLLPDPSLGHLLYRIHLISALLVGLLFRGHCHTAKAPTSHTLPRASSLADRNFFDALCNAVIDSVDAILRVCGFVLFFSVLCAMLPTLRITPLFYGFLEITGGIPAIWNAELIPSPWILPTISALLAWSGVSVLLQTASLLSPTDLSLRPYLIGKLLQGVFSFFLTFLALRIPSFVRPSSSVVAPSPSSPHTAFFFSLCKLGGFFATSILLFIIIHLGRKLRSRHRETKKDPV